MNIPKQAAGVGVPGTGQALPPIGACPPARADGGDADDPSRHRPAVGGDAAIQGLAKYRRRRPGAELVGATSGFLGSLWLLYHLRTSDLYQFTSIQSEYGPLSWPTWALTLLVLATGFMCATRAVSLLLGRRSGHDPSSAINAFDNVRVAIGGAMIVGYGVGIVFLGFLIGSILFLSIWMLLGRMRNPLTIVTISVLGTVAPLYLLVKVAYLPLPRGVGFFNTATLKLYEWLGIF